MNAKFFIWAWHRDSVFHLQTTKIQLIQPESSENTFKVLHSTNLLFFDFESQNQLPLLICGSLKIYHWNDRWMWALKTLHINISKRGFVISNITHVSPSIIHLPQVVVSNLRGQKFTIRGRLFDKPWFFKNQLLRILMLKDTSSEIWIFTLWLYPASFE